MSKRVLTTLFIISMAFNIAFVSVFGYHLITNHRAPHLIPPGINPKVRDHYFECREEIAPFMKEFHKSKQEFILELTQKDIDEKKLLTLLGNSIEKQMRMEHELGLSMIEMRKRLTPKEAQKIFHAFDKRTDRFRDRIKSLRDRRIEK